MHWDVMSVEPLSEFRIRVELRDGQKGIFDLKPYLTFGIFRELQDPDYFRQVGILFDAVTWPHGQDIAPETLVAGLRPMEQSA
jgi:hypothetical protein